MCMQWRDVAIVVNAMQLQRHRARSHFTQQLPTITHYVTHCYPIFTQYLPNITRVRGKGDTLDRIYPMVLP